MEKEKSKLLCGAKLRGKNKTCRRLSMKGRKKCRLHGGASLSGIASPSFKHGRYSKVLKKDVRKKFEEAGKDPQLLSHEPELKLLDVRLDGLVSELGQEGGPESFAVLKKTWKEFQGAKGSNDPVAMDEHLEAMDRLFSQGIPDRSRWTEIRDVMETRRRMLESESRRIRDSQTSMSTEQVLAIIDFVADVLHQSVHHFADRVLARQILSKVTTEIGVIVSKPDKAPPGIARLLS